MFDRSKCDLCGDCFVRCQYVDYDEDEAVRQMMALIEGKEAEILAECMTCCSCNHYCPTGANPFDLITEMQEKLGMRIADEEFYEIQEFPNEIIKGDPDKPIMSLCVIEPWLPPDVLDSQLFKGMTLIKGSKYFAWMGVCHLGWSTPIRENAQAFVDNLAELGAKEILFIHADDYAMLTEVVKGYGIEVPFRPINIIEYLRDYLKENQSSITRLNKRIAYQRNCADRCAPVDDSILGELFELIGVERVNRKHDREGGLCCGALFVKSKAEQVSKIQDMNLNDAKDHGAEAMVFLCPVCLYALGKGTEERGMAPIFITDICKMALGEKPFPS
ncbi:MAG: (Fe-S)-binding protein [Deltaproteobacteria bacterium]|nr:MAG: (Fe-S)-binding protein [Deltaproteobacteria bacterium]